MGSRRRALGAGDGTSFADRAGDDGLPVSRIGLRDGRR